MDLNTTPEPPIIVEIKESMISMQDDVLTLSNLMVTSNLQYLTRTVREDIFKRLLDNLGALEDQVKALVKEGRAVRRETVPSLTSWLSALLCLTRRSVA